MALVDTILPYLQGQTREQETRSMTNEVIIVHREESAPTTYVYAYQSCPPSSGCMTTGVNMNTYSFVQSVVFFYVSQKTLSASALLSLSTSGGCCTVILFTGVVFNRQETAPQGLQQFVPGLSLPQPHRLTHKYTALHFTLLK